MSVTGLGPTDGSHLDNANPLHIDTIPASAHPHDLFQCISEHEKAGTPLVITGVDRDSQWNSWCSPTTRDGEPVNRRTGAVRIHPYPLF